MIIGVLLQTGGSTETEGRLSQRMANPWHDTDGNYYVLYYLDTVEVYEGDEFTAYALPCSTSGFDNVGGGTTNVVIMLASYMG